MLFQIIANNASHKKKKKKAQGSHVSGQFFPF